MAEVEARSVAFQQLVETKENDGLPAVSMDLVASLELPVQVELGRVRLTIQELLELSPGNVLELDKAVGEPIEVYVADKLVARGEIVVTIGDRLGVRITELIRPT